MVQLTNKINYHENFTKLLQLTVDLHLSFLMEL